MEKIPTIFVRDPACMQFVTEEVTPGCEWVLAGEGIATRKRDGTNIRVTVSSGCLVLVEKRRNPTREEKAAGAEPGYVTADSNDPSDKHIYAAVDATDFTGWPDGAWPCEALGPKIQGGVEGVDPSLYPFSLPDFASQSDEGLSDSSFSGIKEYLQGLSDLGAGIEGIVFHHPDGRMAKIKSRDFGIRWPK